MAAKQAFFYNCEKFFFWRLILLPLFFFSAPTILLAQAPSNLEESQLALQNTLAQLNALDEWITETEQKSNLLQIELREQDQRIAGLTTKTRQSEKRLNSVNRALRESNTKIVALESERRAQSKAISIHLQAAYRLGGQDFFKQLLNQESPAELEKMMRYHGHFGAQRLALIEEYTKVLAILDNSKKALKHQKTRRNSQLAELKKQRRDIRRERDNRAISIGKLAAQRNDKTKQQQILLADSQRLQTLIQTLQLESESFDNASIGDAKGDLPLPMVGRLKHRFGETRAGGQLRWRGVTISADLGTPVSAVFRGRVVFADWLRGFGLMAIIDHGEGYMTMYGFCDSLNKTAGDWIESGETIANAGNSGGQAEPGVYFEIRHDGKVSDPLKWLRL